MNDLIIHHHGNHVLAIDPASNLANASLLVIRFGRSVEEHLLLSDTLPSLEKIAERNSRPLHAKWRDIQLRARHKPDFLRDLTAASIIRRVSGTVGGHSAVAPGVAGNGVRNHAAGLWVHPDLAAGLARWAECRGETWRPSPLAEFVEQLMDERTGGKAPSKDPAQESAAETFAGMVGAVTMQNLRAMDQILIDGKLSLIERQQTLQARLDQQAGHREAPPPLLGRLRGGSE